MEILYSARSHIGRVRECNEDNLFVDGVVLPVHERGAFAIDGCTHVPAIFAVCDGMGGESDGKAASRIAVETLFIYKDRITNAKPRQIGQEIKHYVQKASEAITLGAKNGKRMGTTLALAAISNSGVYCFNAGDSRIYSNRRNCFQQITNDHTVAAEQIRDTRFEKRPDPSDKHKLTRCIGIGRQQHVEQYPALGKKGRLLICSDGLTNMVKDDEIKELLCSYSYVSDAANALLQAALKKGGRDNITAIVLDIKSFWASTFWGK